jgi:signal transduction histidine kinase/ActR/RegA family two-component response regulator
MDSLRAFRTSQAPAKRTSERAAQILAIRLDQVRRESDGLFAWLMVLQWLGAILVALWLSPWTWDGDRASPHPHVWAALGLGFLLTSLPCYLAIRRPGEVMTRHVVAATQMLWSGFLIHLTGGRIETHFHIFGSLAFLAWYRDWKVLATATIVVGTDHLVRGLLWPQSVYGVPWPEFGRTMEHVGWVAFEDVFLLISIHRVLREMTRSAETLAELEESHDRVEAEVAARTLELQQQTDRLKRQTEELALVSSRAEQANQAKSEFLANMSHEIRTPMTAILGFTDLLLSQPRTVDEVRSLNTIQRNGDNLLGLINDILDLSKIEAGRLDIERVAVDVRQLTTDVLALMRVRSSEKNLDMTVEWIGDPPRAVLGDPIRLRQVLINLVGNAIKFTEQGGVRIVVRAITLRDARQGLQFDVIDTGIGIDPEIAAKLFQPFSQADTSTTRRFGGTGLGLAICRRLARLMGGDIEALSEPGLGSTFRFYIEAPTATIPEEGVKTPIEWPESQAERAAQRQQPLPARVLLAEDGLDNQRLISRLLTLAGANVEVVSDGVAAVQSALTAAENGAPYDLILMDMQMPSLDGYGATRQLRAQRYLGPIVALTAHAMSGDRERCLEAGCDDYLTKPIDRATLVAMLQRFTPAPRASEIVAAG